MVLQTLPTAPLSPTPQLWLAAAGAYLAEVKQRTGSERTPEEYGRYIKRFLEGVTNPAEVEPATVHSFAYGVGPSGKAPSASTVSVRIAAIRGFLDRDMLHPRHPSSTRPVYAIA